MFSKRLSGWWLYAVCGLDCVVVSGCHGVTVPLPPDQVLSSLGLLLLISGVFGTTSLQTETLSSQHRAQTSRLVTSADTDTGDMGTWGHDDMCLVSSLVTGRGHTADWGLQAAAAAAWAWLPRPDARQPSLLLPPPLTHAD